MHRVEIVLFSSDDLIREGPSLNVHVGFDSAYNSKSAKRPQSQILDVRALIDTGATMSSIDTDLADKLKLPRVDQQPVAGVSGKDMMPVFLAQIYVPDLSFIIYGRFHGARLTEGGIPYQVLLGRSFLSHFIMTYDGIKGQVTLLR